MRGFPNRVCDMLPDPIFRRLDRAQMAEYVAELAAETARARARLLDLDHEAERYSVLVGRAAAMRAARAAADPTPERLRIAVRMARAGARDSEIAERLGVSITTARRVLHRAWSIK